MENRLKQSAEFRSQAEAIVREKTKLPENIAAFSSEEIQERFHELQVHQVELEMQNEELRRTQVELAIERERYFDLYDLAPAGYFILSENGLILAVNLTGVTLLQVARGTLINKPFSQFVFKEDQDLYYLNRRQVLEANEPKVCELRMVKPDGTIFWVHLAVTVLQKAGGIFEYRVVMSDINDRKRAENALRESEEQFQVLFKHPSVGVANADPATGRFLRANTTFCRLVGCSERELLQRTILDVTHPEDREVEQANFNALVEGRIASFQSAKRYLRPDGTIVWIHVTVSMVHDAAGGALYTIAIIQDITELKRAEQALDESEESFRNLADAIPQLCWMANVDGRIFWYNQRWYKYTGTTPEQMEGWGWQSVHDPEVLPQVLEKWHASVTTGKPFDMVFPLRGSDGVFRHFLTRVMPLSNKDGEVIRWFGTNTDITDQKRIEEELLTINNDLERRVEQRTQELQETQMQYLHAEKLSAIGRLSASIAHEFNNPLQGILTVLKGLQKRAIMEEEDRELLDGAIGEGDRIKNLICNLQDFNQPSSGKEAFMDVHKALDALLLLHKSDFNGRQIAVVRNYAEKLPLIVAVPDQIKQVFLNLLANAADACLQSGGVITVSTRQEDKKVAVAIQDTGVGIKPEEMEHIFRPFYTTKPEVKGTGLGLSVSYGIVKNHQGEIRVKSQLEVGTTFTVLLPIKGSATESI